MTVVKQTEKSSNTTESNPVLQDYKKAKKRTRTAAKRGDAAKSIVRRYNKAMEEKAK